MSVRQDSGPGSLQRLLDDGAATVQSESVAGALRERLATLELELVRLRAVEQAHARQDEQIARLREANEHLVLAALSAQHLRDDAEATNQRQNEFLAMLAHELRNPLAPIGMAAALLARTPSASPQLTQMTRVIARQVDHMSRLLDDLLDAARISSGKITLTLQAIELSTVLAQAIETVMPRLKERHQNLVIDVAPARIVTEGDTVRLTQVFTNLLGNASKYTGDHGEIRLSAVVDAGAVAITVADNGFGIPADVLPHIFDLFTQGPRSLARSEGGLGVGLNVVRNLITMHGGQVDARSEVGVGSSFTVTLPVSQATLAVPDTAHAATLPDSGCAILLIEDNVDACDTLHHLLTMEGHSVEATYDGISGLQAALRGSFDVIICDIGLPGLDGYQVIGQLRGAGEGARPYAIALSGYCQAEDRTRALDAGFDQYLVKPIQPDALLAVIGAPACQERRRA